MLSITAKSKAYDILMTRGRAVLSEHNPCNIRIEDGKTKCNGPTGDPNWCCEGCKHHDPAKGCTVDALGCKLWLCWCATKEPAGRATFIAFEQLKQAAKQRGVPLGVRMSKDENFELLKRGIMPAGF